MRAYLDHAASTSMVQCARSAVSEAMGRTGNASSVHAAGRDARRTVEESRERIAALVGCAPTEVIFTSGGTESDNLAVVGLYRGRRASDPRRTRILLGATEHHAVMDTANWLARYEGAEVFELPVDATGVLQVDSLTAHLRSAAAQIALVAVMWANNEVGAVNPIREVAELCARYEVPLAVDAVQAFAQMPVSLGLATSVAISSHKFGGPAGVGALIAARGARLAPLLHGGGQERQLRSGSLNVPGIAGMAAAAEHSVGHVRELAQRLSVLRTAVIRGVQQIAPEAVCNGPAGVIAAQPSVADSQALPGLAHFTFPGHRAAAMLMVFDSAGICVSTGAACSAGVMQPSHVLAAMGQPESLAASNLRVSLGHDSTLADVQAFLDVLPLALARSVVPGARSLAGVP